MGKACIWVMVCACGGGGGALSDGSISDASPDALQKRFGVISLVENKTADSTLALGIFGTNLDIIVSTRDDGPCQIQLANTGTSQPVSAGTRTISAASAATITIPFDPEGYFAMASGLLYGANEQLMVSAQGATVPAFSAQLTFPAAMTVTSGSPTVLSKSGFTATWMTTTSPVAINGGRLSGRRARTLPRTQQERRDRPALRP